jgi:hypothetical protein
VLTLDVYNTEPGENYTMTLQSFVGDDQMSAVATCYIRTESEGTIIAMYLIFAHVFWLATSQFNGPIILILNCLFKNLYSAVLSM